MKLQTTLILVLLTALTAAGQSNPTEAAQPIVEEGKMLYRSEMASWYGTDLFLAAHKTQDDIGGYVSYSTGDFSKCVFYSRDEPPHIIGTITFDSTYNTKTASADLRERTLTDLEMDLYELRKNALHEINSDTLFKHYSNTNLNVIPLIYKNEKKVYVLTGPEITGVLIFGNDYLLTFDSRNKLLGKKMLHKNIIPVKYGKQEEGEPISAVHLHRPETGDFMTSTDICTIMLYEKMTTWKSCHVISEKYLNIWDCEKNQLTVITREALDKIDEDQNEKKKKRNR